MFDRFDTDIKTCIGNAMLALTDRIFPERERLLQDLGRLGWERQHLREFGGRTCYGDAYELEQRQWGLEWIRRVLSLYTYTSPEFERLFQQRIARESPVGVAAKALESDTERHGLLQKILKENRVRIFSCEESLFGADAGDVVFTCGQDIEDFTLATLARELPDFAFDKRLSAKDEIVLSKPFISHWRLTITLRRDELHYRFAEPPFPRGSPEALARCETQHSVFSIQDTLITHEKNRGFRKLDQNLRFFADMIDNWTCERWAFRTAPQLLSHIRFEAFTLKRKLEVFEAPLAQAFVECARRLGHSSS